VITHGLWKPPLKYSALPGGRDGAIPHAFRERGSPESSYRAAPVPPIRPASCAPSRARSTDVSTAKVRLHLKPGQKGTKQLVARYGDRLLCVRYRYDARSKKRLKTVELLVSERVWTPPRPRFAPAQLVGLRVAFADVAVRERVKQAGGTWHPGRTLWQLRYDRVVALGLTRRIVTEDGIL
jgi:hypothetical protein